MSDHRANNHDRSPGRGRLRRRWGAVTLTLLIASSACSSASDRGAESRSVGSAQQAISDSLPSPGPNPLGAPPPIAGFTLDEPASLGYLEGQSSISPTGSFSYTVPLQVPPANITPNLALRLGNGGHGPFGLGGSLTGLSTITRCAKNLLTEGVVDAPNFDNLDSYCLDGEKLVHIGPAAQGSELRTENESYAKIIAVGSLGAPGGPSQFLVYKKDGRILTFEARSRERRSADATGTSYVTIDSAQAVWLLTAEEDRHGNQIRYDYAEHSDADTHAKGWVISSIQYDYHNGSETGAKRKIEFDYQASPFPVTRFKSGFGEHLPVRATAIRMSYDDALMWRYNLAYDARGRMTSVQQCGAQGHCKWKKQFKYADQGTAVRPSFDSVTYSAPTTIAAGGAAVFDVNHDGRDDFLYWRDIDNTPTSGAAPYVRLTTVTQATGAVQPLGDDHFPGTEFSSLVFAGLPVDPQGDGRWAYMAARDFPCAQTLFRWNGTKFVDTQDPNFFVSVYVPPNAPFDCRAQLYPQLWTDLDGDGRMDRVGGQSDHGGWQVQMNNGGTLAQAVTPAQGPPSTGQTCEPKVADLDGDGRGEVIFTSDCATWYAVTTNDWKQITSDPIQLPFSGQFDLVDLNGDGLADAFHTEKVNGVTHASIAWNLGTGAGHPSFSPAVPVSDPAISQLYDGPLSGTLVTWKTKLQAIDLNDDGFEDLLILDGTGDAPSGRGVYALLSRGNGRFDLILPGQALRSGGAQVGDFNGDGLKDIVTWDGQTIEVLTQKPGEMNKIVEVWDEGAPMARERVEYDRVADHDASHDCGAYPFRCARRGMPVVSAHEVSQGADIGAYRRVEYAYEKGRMSAFEGFLGFERTRSFDTGTGREAITEYDLDTLVDNRAVFARQPKSTLEITPIWNPAGAQPSTAYARVTLTTYDAALVSLNGGKTATVRVSSSDTKTWEATAANAGASTVTIDWAGAGFNRIGWTGAPAAGFALPTAAPNRAETRTYWYDQFGNVTRHDRAVSGGETRITQSVYAHDANPSFVDNWLIGLPVVKAELSISVGQAWTLRERTFEYLSNGDLHVERLQPNGSDDERQTITHTYDSYGKLTQRSVTAMDGIAKTRTTYFSYDGDHVFETARWDGAMSQFQYVHPAYGATLLRADSNEVVHATQIDDLGRVVKQTRSIDGHTDTLLQVQRSARFTQGGITGIVTSTVDPRVSTPGHSNNSLVHTDELGREVLEIDPAFDPTKATYVASYYDALGRLRAKSRPSFTLPGPAPQEAWYYETDTLGRNVKAIAPDGAFTTQAYTYWGQVQETATTDANGRITWATRNADGLVIANTQLDDHSTPVVTSFSYGPFGLLTGSEDAAGNTTTFEYDALGRRTHAVTPDAGDTRQAYNGFGEVRETKTAMSVRTYVHDYAGRQVQIADGDDPATAQITQFDYGTLPRKIGKLVSTTSPDGIVVSYDYDTLGRATQQTWTVGGESFAIDTEYDSADRVTKTTYPSMDPGLPRFAVSRAYNAAGAWSELQDTSDPQNAELLWRAVTRTASGALGQEELGNGLLGTRTYQPHTDRVSAELLFASASSPVASFGYAYDPSGRITARTELGGASYAFDYDALGRLSRERRFSGAQLVRTTDYGYEVTGNLLTVTVDGNLVANNAYGQADAADPWAGPHALTQDHVSGRRYVYDANGRMTEAPDFAVVWTPFNLPRAMKTAGGDQSFQYDAGGARVRKSFEGGEELTIGGIYKRVTKKEDPAKHVFMVIGPEGAIAEITFDVGGGTSSRTKRYLHKSNGDSVRVITDEFQNVLGRFDYDAFGKRDDGTAVGTQLMSGFQGHDPEDEIGLTNMKGRIYSPGLGRFLTPDPFVSDPMSSQAYNRYSFVQNDPINRTDPTGYVDKTENTSAQRPEEATPDAQDGVNKDECKDANCEKPATTTSEDPASPAKSTKDGSQDQKPADKSPALTDRMNNLAAVASGFGLVGAPAAGTAVTKTPGTLVGSMVGRVAGAGAGAEGGSAAVAAGAAGMAASEIKVSDALNAADRVSGVKTRLPIKASGMPGGNNSVWVKEPPTQAVPRPAPGSTLRPGMNYWQRAAALAAEGMAGVVTFTMSRTMLLPLVYMPASAPES